MLSSLVTSFENLTATCVQVTVVDWDDSIIFFMIVGYLPCAMAFVMNDFMS